MKYSEYLKTTFIFSVCAIFVSPPSHSVQHTYISILPQLAIIISSKIVHTAAFYVPIATIIVISIVVSNSVLHVHSFPCFPLFYHCHLHYHHHPIDFNFQQWFGFFSMQSTRRNSCMFSVHSCRNILLFT